MHRSLAALITSLALSCDGGASKPDPQPTPYDSIPASATITIQGLHGPIDIVRDVYGVPHIYATDLRDLGFGFGYVEASDRLAQMDLFRHVASGTISELFGALQRDQIDNDIEMRMHRMRPLAEETWAAMLASTDPMDQEIVRYATGFSDGVNLFLSQVVAGERTIDPAILVWFDPERTAPWTPVDSLTIGRLQQWALSYFADEEIRLTRALQESRAIYDGATDPHLLRRAGGFFDLLMIRPADTTSTIDGYPNFPNDSGTRAKPGPAPGAGNVRPWVDPALLDAALHTLREKALPNGTRLRSALNGSNNWVVGPDLAGAGRTMLANDPHLPLSNPPIFYLVHLTVPGVIDVQGVTFPGIPVVLLGHNEHIAWGGTVVFHDITDVYAETIGPCSGGGGECADFGAQEVPVETWTETFGIGARGTITETMEVTYEMIPNHGPVIPTIVNHQVVPRTGSQALSVKFSGYEATFDVRALWKMNRAADVNEAFAALEDFTHGGQNWVIIDDQGHFGWTTIEHLPWRSSGCFSFSQANPDGVSPYLVAPGDGSCEWEGWMDPRYVPHAIDHPQGFIATANADPVGETFDGDGLNGPTTEDGHKLYVGSLYDPGFRIGRITRLLTALRDGGTDATLEDLAAIQGDVRSSYGERMTPHLLAALDAFAEEWATPGTHPDLQSWAGSITQAQGDRLLAARDRLAAWSFDTPPALDPAATPGEIGDSVATSIFNAWAVTYIHAVLEDELARVGEHIEDAVMPRTILAIHERPEDLVTGIAPETNQPVLCDDLDTAGLIESCTLVMLLALDGALDWATTDGFGSPDMNDWRWGYQHRLVLNSLLPSDDLDLPPPPMPGYPRHGDNYSVDSSDHGYGDYDFTYGSGPAMRHLTEFNGPGQPRTLMAIPGGEVFDRSSPHFSDLMDQYWSVNEYFELPFTTSAILSAAEDRWRLQP